MELGETGFLHKVPPVGGQFAGSALQSDGHKQCESGQRRTGEEMYAGERKEEGKGERESCRQ